MRNRWCAPLGVVAAIAFGSPLSVNAQQTTNADPASDTTLQEVIVTAQRRSERLEDVPISITAVSGQQLANSGVTTSIDLTMEIGRAHV